MEAKIEVEQSGDYTIIHIFGAFHGGERDMPRELKDKIKELVNEGFRKILIDFEKVTFFASDGIGAITNGHYTACNAGGRLVPYNMPAFIEQSFKIVGLDMVFPIYNSIDEAKKYLDQKVK